MVPGSHTIKASYAGDSYYLPTSAALVQVITKANTAINLMPPRPAHQASDKQLR